MEMDNEHGHDNSEKMGTETRRVTRQKCFKIFLVICTYIVTTKDLGWASLECMIN